MSAYIVAGLTATLLATAAARFWKRCFGNPDPAGFQPPLDGALRDRSADARSSSDGATKGVPTSGNGTPHGNGPPAGDAMPSADVRSSPDATPQPPPVDAPAAGEGTPDDATPAARLGVRWSWRRHRPSGLQFLRVTVTNAGPNAAAVTRIRLGTSAELADHADPPATLLEASDRAAALFGPDAEGARLPRPLDPGAGADAYFPCRDVADWLYGVAEGDNLDRSECHLTPECVDEAGVVHPARRPVNYETWLTHGHGPSLQEHLDGRDPQSGDDPG